MLKFSFTSLIVFAFLFTLIFSPNKTLACGPVPQTIYSLYTNSENIYIATFNGKVLTSTEKESENLKVNISEAKFNVEKVIKGANLLEFIVDHRDYEYSSAEVEESGIEEVASDHDEFGDSDISVLKNGDRVLIFVNRDTEVKNRLKMTLADSNFGLKKLKSEEMDKYTSALEQLASIYSKPNVEAAELAGWFVKLIEEPVTRWDGSQFLAEGLYYLKYEEEMKKEAASKNAGSESESIEAQNDIEKESTRYLSETDIVKALNSDHKAKLMSIAIGLANDGGLTESKLVAGNEALMRVAVNIASHAEINQILSSLYDVNIEPYISSSIISEVAGIVEDADLSKLNQDFSYVAYEEKDAVYEPLKIDDEENKTEEPIQPEAPVVLVTVGEKRTEILTLFINRAAILLSQTAQN